jgi:hypothetical protein
MSREITNRSPLPNELSKEPIVVEERLKGGSVAKILFIRDRLSLRVPEFADGAWEGMERGK